MWFSGLPDANNLPDLAYPDLLYRTAQGTAYLAFSQQNTLYLRAWGNGRVAEQSFACKGSGAEAGGIFPLLLSHTGQGALLLVDARDGSARIKEQLYLIRIDQQGVHYTPVRYNFDQYLTGPNAGGIISFIAGSAAKAAVCGQRLYIGDPCGEDTWSFGLNDDSPALSYEMAINRYTKPWVHAHPSDDGPIKPAFSTFGGILTVYVDSGHDSAFWAFRDGRLLGEMSVEDNNKIQLYAGSTLGRQPAPRHCRGWSRSCCPMLIRHPRSSAGLDLSKNECFWLTILDNQKGRFPSICI